MGRRLTHRDQCTRALKRRQVVNQRSLYNLARRVYHLLPNTTTLQNRGWPEKPSEVYYSTNKLSTTGLHDTLSPHHSVPFGSYLLSVGLEVGRLYHKPCIDINRVTPRPSNPINRRLRGGSNPVIEEPGNRTTCVIRLCEDTGLLEDSVSLRSSVVVPPDSSIRVQWVS